MMRTLEDLLRKVLNARNIRSDEPAPGKMQRFFIPRIFSIALMSPSECVGGEVCSNHGKYCCNMFKAFGEGGNQASNTSALIIFFAVSRFCKSSPIALKKEPP